MVVVAVRGVQYDRPRFGGRRARPAARPRGIPGTSQVRFPWSGSVELRLSSALGRGVAALHVRGQVQTALTKQTAQRKRTTYQRSRAVPHAAGQDEHRGQQREGRGGQDDHRRLPGRRRRRAGLEAGHLVDADRQASSAEWLEQSTDRGCGPGRGAVGADGGPCAGRRRRAWPWSTPRRATSGSSGPPWTVPTLWSSPPGPGASSTPGWLATLEMIGKPDASRRGHLRGAPGHQRPRRGGCLVDRVGVPDLGDHPRTGGDRRGPEARLYRDGLDAYDAVLKKAVRKRPG